MRRAFYDLCAKNPGQHLYAAALAAPPGLESMLLATGPDQYYETVAFKDQHGPLIVGLGSASRLRAESIHPFEETVALLAEQPIACDEQLLPWVRYFGGGAFDPRRTQDENCWREFGAATFILPRLTYFQSSGAGVCVVACRRDEIEDSIQQVERLLDRTKRLEAEAGESPPVSVLERRESVDPQEWEEMLGLAQRRMVEGSLSKVVAARRLTVRLSRAPQFECIVEQLLRQSVDCTIFGLRLGHRLFVGATPETLIAKQGSTISADALAGTRAIALDDDAERVGSALFSSQKDRAEHAFVTESLEQTLAPLCKQLSLAKEPSTRRLRNMVHLWTPLRGELSEPTHVLQLVARLHPTPAVGGVPREAALDFILQQEPKNRGWYAAPFGFIDPRGDGRFVVALRSALINGDMVHAYAGAGIVRASDARSEFAETELKMTSILGALGLSS